MLKIIILSTRHSSLIVSFLSMTHFLLDTERKSSQKYSGSLTVQRIKGRLQQRALPWAWEWMVLFWGGQAFGWMCLLLRALDSEEGNESVPQRGCGSRHAPDSNFIDGWSGDSVKYPPGLGVLTPLNGSVLNYSNQNMAGHWESWSLKTNQRSRQDIEILRTCSFFPVSPRKQQSQLCSTQSTHTGGVRTGRHFLLPVELCGFNFLNLNWKYVYSSVWLSKTNFLRKIFHVKC